MKHTDLYSENSKMLLRSIFPGSLEARKNEFRKCKIKFTIYLMKDKFILSSCNPQSIIIKLTLTSPQILKWFIHM